MAHHVAVDTQENNRQHLEENYLVICLEKWQVVFEGTKLQKILNKLKGKLRIQNQSKRIGSVKTIFKKIHFIKLIG
jgi:hypothetical protein